jgi:twinkle protein
MSFSREDWATLGIDTKGREWSGYGSPNLKTKCPTGCSQKERKQDLSINLETGAYACKNPGCGFKGYLGGAAPKIVRRQTDGRISGVKEYDRAKFSRLSVEEFWAKTRELPAVAVDYLHARGFTDEAIKRVGLRWGPVYKDDEHGWVSGIWTPYLSADREYIANVKKRPLDKSLPMGMLAGGELIFYGICNYQEMVSGEIRPRRSMVITEGEYDTLALWQAGVTNAMSVPNGTSDEGKTTGPDGKPQIESAALTYLTACAEELAQIELFILFLDDDKPGRTLQRELARRLGEEKCLYVVHPKGCKDANDVLVKHGPEVLAKLVEDAQPYPITGLARPRDLLAEVLSWKKDGMPSGFSTGWPEVDALWRPVEGQMTIVTGVPSMGKSEFLDALIVNLYRLHGWKGLIFSPESFPSSTHLVKLLEKWVGKPFDDRVARMWQANRFPEAAAMSEAEVLAGVDDLQQAFSFIMPDLDGEGVGIDKILEYARQEVFRRGIKIVVIDPWNEIEHLIPQGMQETQYVSKVLSKIRRFARRHGLHIFLVAHPTKMQKVQEEIGGVKVWTYPIPTLYDVSGGAHWYNKADNGIVVWRDFYAEARDQDPNLNTIKFDKVKLKWTGQKGQTHLQWDPPTGRYLSPGDDGASSPHQPPEVQTSSDGEQGMFF